VAGDDDDADGAGDDEHAGIAGTEFSSSDACVNNSPLRTKVQKVPFSQHTHTQTDKQTDRQTGRQTDTHLY
jgi:hypothetical protein